MNLKAPLRRSWSKLVLKLLGTVAVLVGASGCELEHPIPTYAVEIPLDAGEPPPDAGTPDGSTSR